MNFAWLFSTMMVAGVFAAQVFLPEPTRAAVVVITEDWADVEDDIDVFAQVPEPTHLAVAASITEDPEDVEDDIDVFAQVPEPTRLAVATGITEDSEDVEDDVDVFAPVYTRAPSRNSTAELPMTWSLFTVQGLVQAWFRDISPRSC